MHEGRLTVIAVRSIPGNGESKIFVACIYALRMMRSSPTTRELRRQPPEGIHCKNEE